MASSSCVRLWCHRCTRCFVLHSTVARRASHVSAQVQRCSTAFSVTGLSAVSGSRTAAAPPPPPPPHARHRWKRLYSGDVSAAGKPLSSPAQARDGQENTVAEPWRDTDAVAAPPYQNQNPSSSQNQNPSSSQNQYQNQNPSSSQPTATARETALHLGTRPQLPGLLEETRDEETISTSRPQEETRDEEYGSIVVSSDLPPLTSHSLVSYVDKSETLSRLVHLGVNLRGLEQRANVGTMLLRLDFQTDVAPRLLFLRDLGVEESGLGRLLSKNPFILTESLENLSTRVNYLLSRKFSSQAVASMVVRAPYLLNFSVKRLDNRLAFFQQQLGLSPDNTRDVVARLPRLLCGSLEPIKETLKVCKVEFGFKDNEVQHIILAVPKVLTANKKKLSQIFDYVHNTMHVPHHLIVKFPQVLNCKFLRMQERHLFLQYLSKAQYDPGQPGYVALDRLAATPDHVFCSQVASATPDDFYLFQKTL